MIYERRYIQFNDLVFDGFDMISDFDGDVSFKGSSTEISYGHGSYRPFKANYAFVSERTVSMTITLKMLKLPCEYRPYYNRFVTEELMKPGKLWSIKNGDLQWANAVVDSMSENYSNKADVLVYDVDFVIPGGIWHKADKEKTFLLPYDVCLFMECKGYKTLNPCAYNCIDCCENCQDEKWMNRKDCHCCCVDQITRDMALCYHMDDLQSFYTCDTQYQVVYDCEHAEKFSKNEFLGQKLCTEDICDSSVIGGQFYSETEIPTEDVTVIISGSMVNPWITINGNTNIINGEYDGALIINSNGDVYYQKSECCEAELLDPSVWEIPSGNVYGWTVYPQNNGIVVNLNRCCNGRTCVYVQHDAITV